MKDSIILCPANPYVEALNPSENEFEDRAFKEVKLNKSIKVGTSSNRAGFHRRGRDQGSHAEKRLRKDRVRRWRPATQE